MGHKYGAPKRSATIGLRDEFARNDQDSANIGRMIEQLRALTQIKDQKLGEEEVSV